MLDPRLKSFAQATNYAALTTLFSNGDPQTHIMWVDANDDHLLLNTQKGRAKYRNLLADPRVAVTIFDDNDPYRFVEARGRVVEFRHGAEASSHINRLSWKYDAKDFDGPLDQRVMLVVEVHRVIAHL